VANAIMKENSNLQLDVHEDHTTILLNNSSISIFEAVQTTSLMHFYIFVAGKKYRIRRKLFKFLDPHVKKIKTNVFKKQHVFNLDKFYTKPSIAELCVSVFVSSVKTQNQDLIIEPSAGNGSFLPSLEAIKCSKTLIDIVPENNRITQVDFLK
jgi:hypothetical protein